MVWNGNDKTLKVTLNKNKEFKPVDVQKNTHPSGSIKKQYVYTDIKTYMSETIVESFSVLWKTMIDFDSLARYGKISWDGNARIVSL